MRLATLRIDRFRGLYWMKAAPPRRALPWEICPLSVKSFHLVEGMSQFRGNATMLLLSKRPLPTYRLELRWRALAACGEGNAMRETEGPPTYPLLDHHRRSGH